VFHEDESLPGWPARACGTHLCGVSIRRVWTVKSEFPTPEIVIGISRNDMIFCYSLVQPILARLVVWLKAAAGIALEVGHV
jgi:hypothetical protein